MLQYVCLIFVTYLASVHCIPCQQRAVEVEVPTSVKIGDSATIICNVKPKNEEDHLINVRWYKENEEFYRFTPDETPPIKQFPVPGITVDVEKSSVKTVVLNNVQNQLTANYSCQASWTVPNIATAKDSKEMFVVDELKGEIILTVENENPGYNEQLMGVCITPPSKIAPKITWFLNGYQVKIIYFELVLLVFRSDLILNTLGIHSILCPLLVILYFVISLTLPLTFPPQCLVLHTLGVHSIFCPLLVILYFVISLTLPLTFPPQCLVLHTLGVHSIFCPLLVILYFVISLTLPLTLPTQCLVLRLIKVESSLHMFPPE
uniref:Uncharacterized protein LOC114346289 n=1 Tax=Diabrotica virgifera virgifera TaxID=50390 RepID=A0A6P7H594_DIAVI